MSPASVVPIQTTPFASAQHDPAPAGHQKVLIRDVSFFYGASRALKSINLTLYDIDYLPVGVFPQGQSSADLVTWARLAQNFYLWAERD